MILIGTLTLLAALVWGGLAATTYGWRYGDVNGIKVRRHVLSGKIQTNNDGVWLQSWQDDPGAKLLDPKDIRRIRLTDVVWGNSGLLYGFAKVSGPTGLSGRFAVQVRVFEPSGTRVRDRTLRVSADWQSNTLIPWVLDTQMSTPELRQKTVVRLEPIR
jgi:hypothetical protein